MIVAWGRRGIHVRPVIDQVVAKLSIPHLPATPPPLIVTRHVNLEHVPPTGLGLAIADLADDILSATYGATHIENLAPRAERYTKDPFQQLAAWSAVVAGVNPDAFGPTDSPPTIQRIAAVLSAAEHRIACRYGGDVGSAINPSTTWQSVRDLFTSDPVVGSAAAMTVTCVSGAQRLSADHWGMLDVLGYLVPSESNQWLIIHVDGGSYEEAVRLSRGGWRRRWTQVYLEPPGINEIIDMSRDILRTYWSVVNHKCGGGGKKVVAAPSTTESPAGPSTPAPTVTDQDLGFMVARWCHDHTHDEIEIFWWSVLWPMVNQLSRNPPDYACTRDLVLSYAHKIPGRFISITQYNPRERDNTLIERGRDPNQYLATETGRRDGDTAPPTVSAKATAIAATAMEQLDKVFQAPEPIIKRAAEPAPGQSTPRLRKSKRIRFAPGTRPGAATESATTEESEDTVLVDDV